MYFLFTQLKIITQDSDAMFKQVALAIILIATTLTAHAETDSARSTPSDTAYITDNLHVYMHSGAGKQYRILGSINAGSELSVLATNDDAGFIQVKDSKGRTGWVDKRNISKKPGLAIQNQKLRMQVSSLQAELNEAQRDMPSLRQVKNDLAAKNDALTAEITALETQIKNLNRSRQDASAKEKRDLLVYGGGIAFIGIFIGIIVTLLLSRRKRYDGWA